MRFLINGYDFELDKLLSVILHQDRNFKDLHVPNLTFIQVAQSNCLIHLYSAKVQQFHKVTWDVIVTVASGPKDSLLKKTAVRHAFSFRSTLSPQGDMQCQHQHVY